MLPINCPIVIRSQLVRYLSVSPSPSSSSSSSTTTDSSIVSSSPLPQQDEQIVDNCIKYKPVFETLIGLIVSCKLNVSSKLFSRSSTNYFSSPNENVSLFDASIPATLPIVNRSCLELVIKSALALNCTINPICSFDREHSVDPVNPSGYRLVQSREPIASNGYIKVPIVYRANDSGHLKTIECKSIHLEEHVGSIDCNHLLQFDGINLNSRGLALVKFVFNPSDITPKESISLVNELLLILKRIGATSNRLEERILSIDATIQLFCDSNPCKPVKITLCNSQSVLANHLAHEIGRQKSFIIRKQLAPENHLFIGPLTGGLKPIKSANYDTRTMIEPSIPPFKFLSSKDSQVDDKTLISLEKLTKEIPILPEEERLILMNQYGLSLYQSRRLIVNNYYEIFIKMMTKDESLSTNQLETFSFIIDVIEKSILLTNHEVDQLYDCVDNLVACYHLLRTNIILRSIAIKMVSGWLEGDRKSPEQLIEINDWSTITDDSLIEQFCKKVIEDRSTVAFLVRRGDKHFVHNLARRVKIACNHRIPEDLIVSKLLQLIDSIERPTMVNFVATRNKTWLKRPKLFTTDKKD
ncbi:glutamyl-tRNA(Gln) amidotransferase subunit B, mitochondrial-like [Panonychus citri]|uniref:glutamyl-tRNA(Gln) amidotransferase subunit B, mitochondrial-like n=1 Tax=Panonychus citri TaxID=50023 RepID=UPI0023082225|nr:glutamyl-tRNA(Gln) amidotransferase subunit B, mitochondrial-like [Panonychus citri]